MRMHAEHAEERDGQANHGHQKGSTHIGSIIA
jgi:hypothetical protein